jgi:guanylate kinase
MKGKMIIISAPSGAGKTTIVKEVMKAGLNLDFSVSACSRQPRPAEVDGKDYYFITAGEFRRKIQNGEFIEWEEVYPGQYYGTLKSEINRIWSKGNHVIFDVDVMGGINIKKLYQELALAIFIMPPSFTILSERLQKRHTESEESLFKRLEKARYEMTFADRFDKIITNNDLPHAVVETTQTIKSFLYSNPD